MDLRRAELLIGPLVYDRLHEAEQRRLALFYQRSGSPHPVFAFAGRLLVRAGTRLEGAIAERPVLSSLTISVDPCAVVPSDCGRYPKAAERGI